MDTTVLMALRDLFKRGFEVRFRPEIGGGVEIRLYKDGYTTCRTVSVDELEYSKTNPADYIVYTLKWLLDVYEYDRRNREKGETYYERI